MVADLWKAMRNDELPLRVRRRVGLDDFAAAISRSCDPWSNWKGPTQAASHGRSLKTYDLGARHRTSNCLESEFDRT
jgi:hypothetical protein